MNNFLQLFFGTALLDSKQRAGTAVQGTVHKQYKNLLCHRKFERRQIWNTKLVHNSSSNQLSLQK